MAPGIRQGARNPVSPPLSPQPSPRRSGARAAQRPHLRWDKRAGGLGSSASPGSTRSDDIGFIWQKQRGTSQDKLGDLLCARRRQKLQQAHAALRGIWQALQQLPQTPICF